ncbi:MULTISPECIES: BA14K family protein [unclassified Bartonella]|uniref:BA14K family protein n=2 Tax=Bartonella TaxID=773 RepID=UPI0023618C02|nr:BA14K family protein [Bartonella sp. CM31XJBT]
MKKVIRLAVLSAMSTVTVLMPLNATLANMAWNRSDSISREIDDMMRKMRKETDDAIREIRKKADIPPCGFSRSHCSDRKRGFFSDDFQKFVDDFHKSFEDGKRRFKAEHERFVAKHSKTEQQHHHHHHHHYHYIENKTYHYVERKKTKHRNVHIENSGDAVVMGILGLATGTILGTVLKKPEQPQVVYQIVPQNQIVYQQVPQEQIIYEAPQMVKYEPVQQSWESDWLNYCKKKYRSFNPKTGTFRDRNGLEHVCYAPIN